MGIGTPAGIFFLLMRLICPLVYFYIGLIVLREISEELTSFHDFLKHYVPFLANVVGTMQKSSVIVELWVWIEAIFFVMQKLHIWYLQNKDPLEASFASAPILSMQERLHLWNSMMMQLEESDGFCDFLRGWFFDEKDLTNITRYDVCDFICWSMFESRNQEHLTREESRQLHEFVNELEWRISISMHGYDKDTRIPTSPSSPSESSVSALFDDNDDEEYDDYMGDDEYHKRLQPKFRPLVWNADRAKRLNPRSSFQFVASPHDESPGFFTNLYESYMKRYVGLENFMAEKRQQFQEAEEQAKAAASSIAENAYHRFIDKGSAIDKGLQSIMNKGSEFDQRLHAMNDAIHNRLNDLWDSAWKMKERLETASFLTARKRFLHQQLIGYRMLLERTMPSNDVPPNQKINLMLKITHVNEQLELIEHSATNAFLKATGFAKTHLLQRKEPQRYAKYSNDPLLGLAIYPLMFNISIYALTDGLLRILMKKRGFERHSIGTTVFYYHKGRRAEGFGRESRHDDFSDCSEHDTFESTKLTPIVFCHGIGIGLGYYLSLIDKVLELGNPLFIPEISYVCGFRPWLSRKSILTPHAVVTTLTAMLASFGFMRATFIGHSYGTSWLSYMCKYSKESISAVIFLDPVCFCLHHPCLTKSFVYHQADPGSLSYMIRTDVIINWTIQRSFPWSRIILFTENIPTIPCNIFLSDLDVLIPVDTVKDYLSSKGAKIQSWKDANETHYSQGPINVTTFNGVGHGDWALDGNCVDAIVTAVSVVVDQVESFKDD
jgi:hypothetical protein